MFSWLFRSYQGALGVKAFKNAAGGATSQHSKALTKRRKKHPRPSKGCFLKAFKYLKTTNKHPLEGLGCFIFLKRNFKAPNSEVQPFPTDPPFQVPLKLCKAACSLWGVETYKSAKPAKPSQKGGDLKNPTYLIDLFLVTLPGDESGSKPYTTTFEGYRDLGDPYSF